MRQNNLICAARMIAWAAHPDVQNGGSARGYQDLVLPLTDLNGRRPDRMFMRH
jgi:hypothetical protein